MKPHDTNSSFLLLTYFIRATGSYFIPCSIGSVAIDFPQQYVWALCRNSVFRNIAMCECEARNIYFQLFWIVIKFYHWNSDYSVSVATVKLSDALISLKTLSRQQFATSIDRLDISFNREYFALFIMSYTCRLWFSEFLSLRNSFLAKLTYFELL